MQAHPCRNTLAFCPVFRIIRRKCNTVQALRDVPEDEVKALSIIAMTPGEAAAALKKWC